MKKQDIVNLLGNFIWSFGNEFFIETEKGNFTWKDPDYPGGTNVISVFNGDYKTWCKQQGLSCGRDKGQHFISEYCGTDFTFGG